VCEPACIQLGYNSLFVYENSPEEEYEPGSRQCTDDEISAIRVVLQRLSSLRILNSDDAEDLVQDTLLTVVEKNPGTELEKGLLVWSLGILRKKVGNYYRKAQRYTSLNELEGARRTDIKVVENVSPESRLIHEELQSIIAGALAEFPHSLRKAMELLLTGFNSGEIVKELYPERYQNVINRLYRGRRRLAKELSKYGYGPRPKMCLAGKRQSPVVVRQSPAKPR
jgi:DNA-directed RNA polymerase specialized sigma24 family protein